MLKAAEGMSVQLPAQASSWKASVYLLLWWKEETAMLLGSPLLAE